MLAGSGNSAGFRIGMSMATKKTAAPKTAAKKSAPAAKKAAPAAKKAATAPVAKPLKDTFNKSSLLAHLVEQTELDKKTVQTVLTHLENTIVGAVHKIFPPTGHTQLWRNRQSIHTYP